MASTISTTGAPTTATASFAHTYPRDWPAAISRLQTALPPPFLALRDDSSDDEYTIHILATTSMAILKVSNISWDISTADMVHLFGSYHVDDSDHVHIPIDRGTGKTLNDLFVEMQSPAHVKSAIENLNKTIVKSRALLLSDSSFEELFDAHFPDAQQDQTRLLDPDMVDQIIIICQNYKVRGGQYTRNLTKCIRSAPTRCISLEGVLKGPLNMSSASSA